MFRFLAIGFVEIALLLGAFGLGHSLATPASTIQQVQATTLQARPLSIAGPKSGCAITGDLVGDANPAEVARNLCPAH